VQRALLFDLDDTLMVEEPAATASFLATAEFAMTRVDIDPRTLAKGARERARELWYAAPTHEHCMRIGISSWEGLWRRFEGAEPDTQSLRQWSPTYRREAWRLALADLEVDDQELAEELAERFWSERRDRHEVFPDVTQALARLSDAHAMAIVTNGAACLQREKLAASGLESYFDAVVVSADLGVAKPDASVFEHALSRLGAGRDSAVMVGDSIRKDVDGARSAGLGAVWVNRGGSPAPDGRTDLVEIATLTDLPRVLG
jgi:putative hydrolase of the HAD superfamily